MNISPSELSIIVDELRRAMQTMTDDERIELFLKIQEYYCPSCGRDQRGTKCQCWNDE